MLVTRRSAVRVRPREQIPHTMTDNPTAKRAREVALERHRAELEAVNKRADKWKSLARSGLYIVLAQLVIIILGSYQLTRPWRVSEPPANQPVRLVVICYKGKDGVWKSYAEGHPVQPAKEWMWKPTWKP